ncbi:MAG: PEPxxWA-CTERM sorting domain-containing protein [Caulobacteraceae bacterium]
MKTMTSAAVAASLAAACLFAAPASATTMIAVTSPATLGPGGTASLPATDLFTGNTYDFTFTLLPGVAELTSQAQASINVSMPEPIRYSLYSGLPGSGTLVETSAYTTGPTFVSSVGPGPYYIEIVSGDIAVNGELLAGGLLAGVPEPASWGLMFLGLGAVGGALRSRRKRALAAA